MVAFLCLGFAYLWPSLGLSRDQRISPVAAGLALGIAAAMKAIAWPAVAVAIALLAATCGRRAAIRFTVTAVAVVAVCVGPFLALYPKALIDNTLEFPLGLARVASAAASPLPGHLIAETGHAGHTIVVAALALAGLAIVVFLVVRPPRTVPRAMSLLAGAMTLMFLLAPSTRYGYFIYPLTLVIWLLVAMAGRRQPEADATWGPGEPLASSRTGP
jgi:phosphatidylinositol alpha-1,6-mannosyltransferase